MKHLIIIIIIISSLILISSCKKDQDPTNLNQIPEEFDMPKNDTLDLNFDQINDFVISYKEYATDDVPSSGGSIIGSIAPLDQNQLLYRNKVGNLFLNINDTIRKTLNTNSEWNEYTADLISKDREYEDWDKTWTVKSERDSLYILAYKIKLSGSDKIGWISLEFDTETGEISITDEDSSDGDELIIKKTK